MNVVLILAAIGGLLLLAALIPPWEPRQGILNSVAGLFLALAVAILACGVR